MELSAEIPENDGGSSSTTMDGDSDRHSSGNEGFDAVEKVMDTVLNGPESPDDATDDFSEENPYYDHLDRRVSAAKLSNPDLDVADFPPPFDCHLEEGEVEDTGMHGTVGMNQGLTPVIEITSLSSESDLKGSDESKSSEVELNKTQTPEFPNQLLQDDAKLPTGSEIQALELGEAQKGAVGEPCTAVRTGGDAMSLGTDNSKPLEPLNVTQWRENRAKTVQERDERESVKKQELIENGKSQYEIWEKNYTNMKEKAKNENRKANDAFLNVGSIEKEKIGFTESSVFFAKSSGEEQEVTTWEYVAKLCDLSPNNRKIKSDVSRMRSLMLQLKTEKFTGPKVRAKNVNTI